MKLPKRSNKEEYDDQASIAGRRLVAEKYSRAMKAHRWSGLLCR